MRDLAARLASEERAPRNPAARAEEAALGGGGSNRMRRVAAADSASITHQNMKVYLLRVATLVARGPEKYEVAWKSPRGSVDSRRIDDSTPIFAEMAAPGASFEGVWQERSASDRARIFHAVNRYSEALIARHKQYAAWTGLAGLAATLDALKSKLDQASPTSCLVPIGWGGGLLGKSAYLDAHDESYRTILKSVPLYQKAMQTGLPFPKTRRIVFEGGRPSSLAGWVLLEIA